MRKVLCLSLLLSVFLLPAVATASIGVGVGTGKIEIKETLKSGGIYKLSPLLVTNTGTEQADYTVSTTLNEKQSQLKPDPRWFSFTPNTFTLSPGGRQMVTPTINLPLKTAPGNYFAYLEAHPAQTVKQGTAVVGVAAATKLSFKVVPSNLFFAMYFRLINLYKEFAPLSYVFTALIILLPVVLLIKKFVHIELGSKKP